MVKTEANKQLVFNIVRILDFSTESKGWNKTASWSKKVNTVRNILNNHQEDKIIPTIETTARKLYSRGFSHNPEVHFLKCTLDCVVYRKTHASTVEDIPEIDPDYNNAENFSWKEILQTLDQKGSTVVPYQLYESCSYSEPALKQLIKDVINREVSIAVSPTDNVIVLPVQVVQTPMTHVMYQAVLPIVVITSI